MDELIADIQAFQTQVYVFTALLALIVVVIVAWYFVMVFQLKKLRAGIDAFEVGVQNLKKSMDGEIQ